MARKKKNQLSDSAIVQNTHERAHRNYKNNVLEISLRYFWPKIRTQCKQFAKKCEICLTEKYERHPKKETLKPTPVPAAPGRLIHINVFHLSNKLFISTCDRFSKYFSLREIPNKRNINVVVEEILSQIYPNCSCITTDNEAIFTSQACRALYRQKNIDFYVTPIAHSTTNGQVERTHSTILEIANALAKQNSGETIDEIYNAVTQYNNTIHSVTKYRPHDIFFNQNVDFSVIENNIKKDQENMLKYQNKNREHKTFKAGDIVFMKSDRRRKDKKSYKRHVVKEDHNDTIVTTAGKIIHKGSLRREFLNVNK